MRRLLISFCCVFIGLSCADAAPVRLALLIGNGAYDTAPLTNPPFDAKDLAAELKKFGFTVITKTDADKRAMITAIQEFGQRLRDGDVGLFYFSGHGVQARGVNYLIPLQFNIKGEADIEFEAVDANRILAQMEEKNPHGVNLIFLDACRDNPFKGSLKSLRSGLAEMKSLTGSLIAYATAPNTAALGDTRQRNSIYTKHLLAALRNTPYLSITDILIAVRKQVKTETQDQQVPWESVSLTDLFYFAETAPPTAAPVAQTQTGADITKLLNACAQHVQANRLTSGRGGNALECYEQVLQYDPTNTEALNGLAQIEARYVELATQALNNRQTQKGQQYLAGLRLVNPESPQLAALEERLQAPPAAVVAVTPTATPKHTPVPASTSQTDACWDTPEAGKNCIEPVTGMEFVYIPGGTFQMGCLSDDTKCAADEKPAHTVTLDGFWMGKYEVTNAQYRKFKANHDR